MLDTGRQAPLCNQGYLFMLLPSLCDLLADMGWNVSSDSTAMDWKRSSAWKCLMTSRQRLSEIMMMEACMDWRSSGPSSSTTRWVGCRGVQVV